VSPIALLKATQLENAGIPEEVAANIVEHEKRP